MQYAVVYEREGGSCSPFILGPEGRICSFALLVFAVFADGLGCHWCKGADPTFRDQDGRSRTTSSHPFHPVHREKEVCGDSMNHKSPRTGTVSSFVQSSNYKARYTQTHILVSQISPADARNATPCTNAARKNPVSKQTLSTTSLTTPQTTHLTLTQTDSPDPPTHPPARQNYGNAPACAHRHRTSRAYPASRSPVSSPQHRTRSP